MVGCLTRLLLAGIFWIGTSVHAAEPGRSADAARPAAAGGNQRVALVIGNAAYPGIGALKNPANDATDIAAKLRRLNFQVTLKTNVGLREMLRTLTDFGDKVQPGSEALFFYAGHGMQVRGKNYLIPIDAEIRTENSVSSEAMDVDQLLDKLASARLSMVILDACRNNPFERRFRGSGQGLAQINAPTGTLIAYATAPGKVASDGDGRNGLYTQELLAAMDIAGIKIEDLFKRVRINVVRKSGDAQTPWESSSLTGDFYFQPDALALAQPLPQMPPPVPARPATDEAEAVLWNAIEQSNSAGDYDVYLSQYPNGSFAALARARLDELKRESSSQEETRIWQAAEKGGKTEVDAYLERYPQGRYTGLAQLRLARLKKEAGELKPGKTFKDCDECPEMVVIPAGRFEMGSNSSREAPVHVVTIGYVFAMGKTQVTQRQWRAIMGSDPVGLRFKGCDDCPVENVDWNDAQEFVRKLSQKTGKTYRLPSEAEWEYACRAGTRYTYCGSDDWRNVIWANETPFFGSTHPVARKQPNAWGLFDMGGNVSEVTQDCWNGSYEGAPTDGKAWMTGNCDQHVARGGHWDWGPQTATLRIRGGGKSSSHGLRIARTNE